VSDLFLMPLFDRPRVVVPHLAQVARKHGCGRSVHKIPVISFYPSLPSVPRFFRFANAPLWWVIMPPRKLSPQVRTFPCLSSHSSFSPRLGSLASQSVNHLSHVLIPFFSLFWRTPSFFVLECTGSLREFFTLTSLFEPPPPTPGLEWLFTMFFRSGVL